MRVDDGQRLSLGLAGLASHSKQPAVLSIAVSTSDESQQLLSHEDESEHESECDASGPIIGCQALEKIYQDRVVHEHAWFGVRGRHNGSPVTEQTLGPSSRFPGGQREIDPLKPLIASTLHECGNGRVSGGKRLTGRPAPSRGPCNVKVGPKSAHIAIV